MTNMKMQKLEKQLKKIEDEKNQEIENIKQDTEEIRQRYHSVTSTNSSRIQIIV